MQEEEKDELKTISLKKYVSPEEKELKETKKKNRRLKRCAVPVVIICLLAGWLGGSVFPLAGTSTIRSALNGIRGLGSNKIQAVLEVMENDWFFGSEISDIDTRLTDQALTGITTNDEDPHTEYMSAEEVTAFTQSINRNYVGIGVQFSNTSGTAIVEKVYRSSPAYKAGVQAGDIIYNVEGTDVAGMTSAEIKELVQGDEGTEVTITFIRDGEQVTLKMIREELSTTTYGKVLEDGTAYLQLAQFGDGTPDEVDGWMEDFADAGCTKLIIDLRDNGGGYLTSVKAIAGAFLPDGTVVMQQEYSTGVVSEEKTSGQPFEFVEEIVVLVNENTASAAEVLTLALKEQRDDVTVVGTTTYGKGTVQITRTFDDGSALKYTTSKWLSPNGTWVNNVGITPDEEVYLHDIFYVTDIDMDQDAVFAADSVDSAVEVMQLALDYLGYEVDRTDGYFSTQTEEALKQYETEHELDAQGILDHDTYSALIASVVKDWNENSEHDTQLLKALEILHG